MPRYLALAGPTASGKSAAALAIAQHWPLEIISVDSALVYRGMDIGTAKPSLAERASVAHHLIDICDPLTSYSAAEFAQAARQLINQIHARGHLPLLVGGTMLYFKALFQGLADMPKADAKLRAELAQQAQRIGWPAMHAQLNQLDPVSAARLHPFDSQRIQRALEVFLLSGEPLSHWHKAQQPDRGDHLLISLEPQDRAWLHARIAQRFDAMLAKGLLQEVQALRARGDLHADLPSMRCVGYRQAWQALAQGWPMGELRDKGIFATRQLAKRQITWLRSMAWRQVVACDQPDALKDVLQIVRAFVARSPSVE